MIGLDLLSDHADAAAIVGVVLAEAIALYVGYGVLVGVANPLLERIRERE